MPAGGHHPSFLARLIEGAPRDRTDMTEEMVLWFLWLFGELRITVWIDGGREIAWEISALELAGQGSIAGRAVPCLSAEYQVRSHSGYTLHDTDFADMAALHGRFGVALLEDQFEHDI